jgi:surface antigen
MASVKDSVASTRNRVVAQQGLDVARTLAGSALGGGTGLISSAPGLAMRAANTGAMVGALTSAEAELSRGMVELEAQRAAERVVPDEDRPYEARAILTIANGPSGKSATWQNPQTGASGKVTIRQDNVAGGLRCRNVEQERKGDGRTKKGNMPICLQNGVWYDLS